MDRGKNMVKWALIRANQKTSTQETPTHPTPSTSYIIKNNDVNNFNNNFNEYEFFNPVVNPETATTTVEEKDLYFTNQNKIDFANQNEIDEFGLPISDEDFESDDSLEDPDFVYENLNHHNSLVDDLDVSST